MSISTTPRLPAGTTIAPAAAPTVSAPRRLLTVEEFQALPDRPGVKTELVRGEVVEMSLPFPRHAEITMEIGALLWNFVKPRRLGKVYAETGFITTRGPDSLRGPDVAFVSNARLDQRSKPTGFYSVAADLIVEVTSPGDRPGEIAAKIAEWIAAGARLVWQVYPDQRRVTVHRPDRDMQTLTDVDMLDGEDVLPDFRCPVGDLFA